MRHPDPHSIFAAIGKIDPVFLNTPSYSLASLNESLEMDLAFKDERATPIRSFKGRGADLVVQSFPKGSRFICASAGNFGQGMAWAARRHGSSLTVYASENAVKCKVERMKEFGATVIQCGQDFDEAKIIARREAEDCGGVFIEDGAHAEIAEGAGTLALELLESKGPFDALFVPLGNGALAAGLGCWVKHLNPGTKVIAVSAALSPAMGLAVLGQPYDSSVSRQTIADGIAVRVPVPEAVSSVRAVVDDVIFVDDDTIRRAMTLVEDGTAERVEPAGVAGLAGLLLHSRNWRGKRVAVPLCGGNRDDSGTPDQR